MALETADALELMAGLSHLNVTLPLQLIVAQVKRQFQFLSSADQLLRLLLYRLHFCLFVCLFYFPCLFQRQFIQVAFNF